MVLVQSDDDLAITLALEFVSRRLYELLAYSIVVIQFAIDDSVDGIIGVVERLGSVGSQIVDGKAAVTESWAASQSNTKADCCLSLEVRPTRLSRLIH